MQYRNFGKLEWKVSALGFGAMRLPLLDQNPAHIDEPKAIRMIRYAIDNGVNYLDTAFPYHMGNSEKLVGKALQDGYRSKIRLATKLSSFMIRSPQDFDRYLEAQFKRLQTSQIDFYLLHSLNASSWSQLRDWKVLPWAEKKIREGKIGYLGFSFHDEFAVFKSILDYYDNWTFCQIQYNYLDANRQAGRRGVEYAAAKGLGIVVMEPLRGGQLAKKPSVIVNRAWGDAAAKKSRVEWAFQWLWNQPEISTVLSGMSEMKQVVDNVIYASRSRPGILTTQDLALFTRIIRAYENLAPIPCTACRYCQPCPHNVAIPDIFRIYNEMFTADDPGYGSFAYAGPQGLKEEQRANNCQECGECLQVCPQKIPIPALLKKIHHDLTAGDHASGQPPAPPSFEE